MKLSIVVPFPSLTAAFIAAWTAASSFGASDWYVSPTGDDKYDGSSSNVVSETVGPKLSFKSLMPSVKDGDTVWLLPGDHAPEAMNGGKTRLVVEVPNVKIKSLSGNPSDTAIVGVHGGGMSNNYSSEDAVSCIKFSSAAKNCIVDGITLRDATARWFGASGDPTNSREYGGGIYDASSSCWAINCVFNTCSAMAGGGMYCGNAARCRFIDCSGGNSSYGAALNGCSRVEFCFISGCDLTKMARGTAGGPTLLVNCTIVGSLRAFFSGTATALNTISIENHLSDKADNGAISGATLYATNSLFGAVSGTHIDDSADCTTGLTLSQIGFIDTAHGDWRVSDAFAAATYGDAAHLKRITLPAGYEHRDLDGNLVPTEGVIPAGCLPAVHQTAATLVFKGPLSLKGVGSFAKNDVYRPTAASPIYLLETAAGDNRQIFSVGDGTNSHYPLMDGTIPFAPSLSASSSVEVTPYFVTDVRYADPVNGNDDWDGTCAVREGETTHGPKESLQAAYSVTTGAYPIVLAAAGIYSNGVQTSQISGYAAYHRRLLTSKTVGIRSVEGPEKTFIAGAPDPTTGGLGADAIGGVELNGSDSFLQGFTVTRCYTLATTEKAYQYGAVVGGSGRYVLDCVISNNVAQSGSALGWLTALRCRITDNRSTRHVVMSSTLGNCLLARNSISYDNDGGQNSAYINNSTAYGCTIDFRSPASPGGRKRLVNSGWAAYGCLLVGYDGTETIFTNCASATDISFGNPYPSGLDYRLTVFSTATGVVDRAARSDAFRRLTAWSIDGSFPELDAEGMQTAGAYQATPHLPAVILGTGIAADGFSSGTNVLLNGESGSVTYTADLPNLPRPFVGLEVDGVALPMTASVTCDLPAAGETLTVVQIPATNWYVDAATGSDAFGGGTPETAKATIMGAAAKAVSGDVIHAAPGTYGAAEGDNRHDASATIGSRVVLKEGVSLVSESPEETFIVGQTCTGTPDEGNTCGNGPGAIRCVYLNARASVRGFTLTGGHTRGTRTDIKVAADYRGGAVCGVNSGTCRVVDCIVSNNACRNGTLYGVRAVRSRVVKNVATIEGSGGASCSWYGCLIDGNRGPRTLESPSMVDSCTFGTGNDNGGSPQVLYYSGTRFPVVNTVVLYGRFYGTPIATNCVFLSGMTGDYLKEENCTNCQFLASADDAKVDAAYRPKTGSPLIDAGDRASGAVEPDDTDLDGLARVSNGKIDVGACEYDWRPVYAKDLGRRVRVTAASPSVVETADKTVSLGADGSLVLVCERDAGMTCPFVFTFSVTGTGTLTVTPDGGDAQTFTQAAGRQTCTVRGTGSQQVAFTYAPGAEDTGSAEILRARRCGGFVVTFR